MNKSLEQKEVKYQIKYGMVKRGNTFAIYRLCHCSECQILDLETHGLCHNINECLLSISGHVCYCLEHLPSKEFGK